MNIQEFQERITEAIEICVRILSQARSEHWRLWRGENDEERYAKLQRVSDGITGTWGIPPMRVSGYTVNDMTTFRQQAETFMGNLPASERESMRRALAHSGQGVEAPPTAHYDASSATDPLAHGSMRKPSVVSLLWCLFRHYDHIAGVQVHPMLVHHRALKSFFTVWPDKINRDDIAGKELVHMPAELIPKMVRSHD